jgi:hypothetical protein
MKIRKKPSKKIIHSKIYSKIDDYTLGVTEECTFEYMSKSKISYLPGEEFVFFPPDQIDLLLVYAESMVSSSKNILRKFEESRKVKNELILSDEQDEILNDLILTQISVPVVIHSAIEAFVNQQIFNQKNNFCDHFFIQRHMSLEDKLFKILPRINFKKIDKEYESQIKIILKRISDIRNNIIHQKMEEGKDNVSYLIENILKTDWEALLKEVKIMMTKYTSFLDNSIPIEDLTKK